MGAVRISHSSTRVAVLCIAAFFAGRFLHLSSLPSPATYRGQNEFIVRKVSDRKMFDAQNIIDGSRNTMPQGCSSFEELVYASHMLDDRPPVPHGESGHSFYTVQPMQLLSWYPRAYLFPKFMDKGKCDHVIKIATRRLRPSGLALRKGETLESTREIRTSQGTFMSRSDDPDGILAWIEDKIAVLTGIPAGHGESFNILKYEHGQHYDSHYDSFIEEDYGKQKSMRIATVLVYLSDVEEGGETTFLLEGRHGTETRSIDYKACDKGIKYKPRAGDALLFWSMDPDGTLDRHSLHGGCPVLNGTKWTMTKWIHNKCIRPHEPVPCLGQT